MNQLFLSITKGNGWRLCDKQTIQVKRFVLVNFILTRNNLSYKISKKPNEWELHDSICNIEGTMGKGNSHLWCQTKHRLKPLNQSCEWYQKNQTQDRSNNVEQYVSPCHTFGRNVGTKSRKNRCNSCSDIVPKEDWKSPL